jgi:asparagine synthase (glutamine-hydrolysing)
MNRLQVHRGPDDAGEYFDEETGVGLAMRRLSILDLDGGHQPMTSADGNHVIVFNGEIFNSPELRTQLEAQGKHFTTANSDTEVVLQLYASEGPAFVRRLNGMFAFVIFDRKQKRLFGARDRFGIKPLYLHRHARDIAFASELKSLLALPQVSREINPQSLYHYLTFLAVPDEASILQHTTRLPPAHTFTFDCSTRKFTTDRFWSLDFSQTENRSVNEWAEAIRHGAEEAVQRWTLSDVPVACSLSGGIDSTAIVGMLMQSGGRKLKTFTLGFAGEEESRWDERHLAAEVARRWGTEHHAAVMNPDDLLDDLITMVWHLDEPYGGGLPSWYVFREMSKEVKVGLTGTGGDELFGNYGKWREFEKRIPTRLAFKLRNRFPGLRRILKRPFGNSHHPMRRYLNDEQKRQSALTDRFDDCEDTGKFLQDLYDAQTTNDLRNALAGVDFRTQLAEEFLFMTDRLSMAHSLEARVPFLDNEFVDLICRIPGSVRTRKRDHKYLLKQAMNDLLPENLLAEKKKGFVIPIERWLRKELRGLVNSLLNPSRLKKQGYFRPGFHQEFVAPHLAGTANFTWQIWSALMFQIWHVVFVERSEASRPEFTWKDLV